MPPHTYLHKLCLSLFAQAGETPRVAGASRMESLLSQVRAGEGISFFAQANFRLFQTQGLRAVPLEESPSLAVGIAWNKEEKLSPGVQMLLAFFSGKFLRAADSQGRFSHPPCTRRSCRAGGRIPGG